jgi:3D (Asp-Asp-Asp) domain-containing protein
MPINASDFTINAGGDIRATSVFNPAIHTRYSTLDLHAWLQDLADNPATSGDDLVSILGVNPSELAGKRNVARPMAVTLLPTMNLDDATSRWFKFGSIEQQSGQVLYTGLKVLGTLVANSPIYIEQSSSKITKYWQDADAANFQILVKAKAAGALIAGGAITVYSRKYGQTYSHFDVNLSAGGEQAAALGTSLDNNIALSAAEAEAVWGTMTLTVADTTQDLGGGQGAKLHKGTIALNGTTTLAQAYQALMWATSENSTATINGVPGWRYRKLLAGYAENVAAPFGTFAGGKWFVAQGWWLSGVMAADSKNYQLTSDDGTVQTPPTTVSVAVEGLVAGDYVFVARDSGGAILTNEYLVTASVGANSVNVPSLKTDTPTSGVIRIAGDRYTYSGKSGTTLTGLSPTIKAGGYGAGTNAFIPLLDGVATGATMSSAQFQYAAPFVCRYRVRNGSAGTAIVPFESTLSVTETGGNGTAVRNADE